MHRSDDSLLVFFGQRNSASLGAGPSQQENQADRVSDRQAEEERAMFRGMMPLPKISK